MLKELKAIVLQLVEKLDNENEKQIVKEFSLSNFLSSFEEFHIKTNTSFQIDSILFSPFRFSEPTATATAITLKTTLTIFWSVIRAINYSLYMICL